MKKEMKKTEILSRLKELHEAISMDPDDYIKKWNEDHPNERRELKYEDYWPFMVGTIGAEIEFILNGGF